MDLNGLKWIKGNLKDPNNKIKKWKEIKQDINSRFDVHEKEMRNFYLECNR